MKYIIVSDYKKDNSVSVPDKIAKDILAILNEQRVCNKCDKSYSINNPEVLRNTCLLCALKNQKSVRYLDSYTEDNGYFAGITKYRFINDQGEIYISNNTSDILIYSIPETLKHWGFPALPDNYTVKAKNCGSTKERYISKWNFTGKFTEKYILATAGIEYWDKDYKSKYIRLEKILVKNGSIFELNKRKKATRELYKEAEILAKKDNKWASLYDQEIALLKLISLRDKLSDLI